MSALLIALVTAVLLNLFIAGLGILSTIAELVKRQEREGEED